MNMMTILVADDHPLFRDALASAVNGLPAPCRVVLSGTFEEALEHIAADPQPDLVLLDLNMPGSRGLSGLARIRAEHPAVPVVVVSALDDPAVIRRSISMGASGYVPKSSGTEMIRAAISDVLGGGIYVPEGVDADSPGDPEEEELLNRFHSLTPQQTRVLGMLAEGLLNKQIAYELDVSEATIKAHVSAILLKLGVDSRTQAVILLSRLTRVPDGFPDSGSDSPSDRPGGEPGQG